MARRVFITGGASGMGLVMAEAFLALGDRVAVFDYNQTYVQDIEAAYPDCLSYCADVRDETAISTFFTNVDEAFGGVDILISNTGTGGLAGDIEKLIDEDWRDCTSVNLDGVFLSYRRAARRRKAQKSCLIVLISSTSDLFDAHQRSFYVSAKWGIIGLMKTLAIELGSAVVRVNAICPGAVKGERREPVLSIESQTKGRPIADIREQHTDGVALRRFIPPQEIADMAVYLASEVGRNISCQAISVDGKTERMV